MLICIHPPVAEVLGAPVAGRANITPCTYMGELGAIKFHLECQDLLSPAMGFLNFIMG